MGEAAHYWREVEKSIANGERHLLVAFEKNTLIGGVQLSMCHNRNGVHRAGVEKLMVALSHRGYGVGRALMQTIEVLALQLNHQLLMLDSRTGDVANDLYRKLGFIEAGSVPGYALSSNGCYDSTTFFYKPLSHVRH
nr:GNAT family N-acetyltransferase [Marinibactrum halimedae]